MLHYCYHLRVGHMPLCLSIPVHLLNFLLPHSIFWVPHVLDVCIAFPSCGYAVFLKLTLDSAFSTLTLQVSEPYNLTLSTHLLCLWQTCCCCFSFPPPLSLVSSPLRLFLPLPTFHLSPSPAARHQSSPAPSLSML